MPDAMNYRRVVPRIAGSMTHGFQLPRLGRLPRRLGRLRTPASGAALCVLLVMAALMPAGLLAAASASAPLRGASGPAGALTDPASPGSGTVNRAAAEDLASTSPATDIQSTQVLPEEPWDVAVTGGIQSLNVSWGPHQTPGSSPITSYTATAGGSSCTTGGSASGCTITGLANGTTYNVSVRATSAVGTGPPAEKTGETLDVPGRPDYVNVTPSGSSLALSWGPATRGIVGRPDDGGSPVTGYTATVQPGGGELLHWGVDAQLLDQRGVSRYRILRLRDRDERGRDGRGPNDQHAYPARRSLQRDHDPGRAAGDGVLGCPQSEW